MKKIATILVAAAIMVAARPVKAGVIYTPIAPPPGAEFAVGLVDPGNPGTLNTVYVTSGNGAFTSDTFVFTFALHNLGPLGGPPLAAFGLHFSFFYNNNSIEVLHAAPLGFPNSNYGSISQPPGSTAEPCSGRRS